MATALVMEFPKATQRQYDEVIDALGLKDPPQPAARANLPRRWPDGERLGSHGGLGVARPLDRFVEQRLGAAVRKVGLPAPRPVLVQYIGETSPLPGALETLDDLEWSPVFQRPMGMNGIVRFFQAKSRRGLTHATGGSTGIPRAVESYLSTQPA